MARDLEKYIEVFTEGAKCWRIDSIGHDPSPFVSVRLSGSPIAREQTQYNGIYFVSKGLLASEFEINN